jgi:putative iron-regulated protein
VSELVRGVRINLGQAGVDLCMAMDADSSGTVSVAEIVSAVLAALGECSAGPVTPEQVVEAYADLLFENYGDAVDLAEDLREAIGVFLANPSNATLNAAKKEWLDARPTYLQTEVARFYDGPIDNEEDGPEGLINAWPLDEAYIDYVEGDPDSGIINDLVGFPSITAEVLEAANEAGGETNIATGWHAIEFLLWGQDFDDDGPGMRPFTDYVVGGTAQNQARRAEYLGVVADLLVTHLEQVRDQWAPGVAGNYRADFLALDTDEALRRILTGMGTLSGGELTGERLAVPFETKDQEDEHSCFADNTHVDHRNDLLGIQNVYLGRYGSVFGPGINDLLATVDADLAEQLADQIETAVDAVFDIPVPFDQAIQGADSTPGRMAIATAIDELNAQTDLIADAAEALGISISTTLP